MSKRQTQLFAKMEATFLTELGKLLFQFKVFLSVGQKLLLTLSKLLDFFKETLLCKKGSRNANFTVTTQSLGHCLRCCERLVNLLPLAFSFRFTVILKAKTHISLKLIPYFFLKWCEQCEDNVYVEF